MAGNIGTLKAYTAVCEKCGDRNFMPYGCRSQKCEKCHAIIRRSKDAHL